jgi:hypothetical protein
MMVSLSTSFYHHFFFFHPEFGGTLTAANRSGAITPISDRFDLH